MTRDFNQDLSTSVFPTDFLYYYRAKHQILGQPSKRVKPLYLKTT